MFTRSGDGMNPLSNQAFHDARLANPRSDHRYKQSPGCACAWCRPYPCHLCGVSHTNPSVLAGCLAHATTASVEDDRG